MDPTPTESVEPERAFAQVDSLVQQVISAMMPLRFSIAQTEAERALAYRARYEAVIERGWKRASDMPGGIERDEYDVGAIHILAWDGETLAGTSRLVLPEPGRKLPTEAAFEIVVQPEGKVADAGRFVVTRPYRNRENRVLVALIGRTWLELRTHGYSHVCAAFASTPMMRLYQRLGMQMFVLGPPRVVWGMERYPVRFGTVEALGSMSDRWRAVVRDEKQVDIAGRDT